MSKTLNQQAIACEQAADECHERLMMTIRRDKGDATPEESALYERGIALRYAAETLRTLALYRTAKEKLEL